MQLHTKDMAETGMKAKQEKEEESIREISQRFIVATGIGKSP